MSTEDTPSPYSISFLNITKYGETITQLGLDLPHPRAVNTQNITPRKITTVQIGGVLTKQDVQRARKKQLRALKSLRKIYEEEGTPLFEITTLNDITSIEADYGAPIEGLRFFGKFLKPSRAYRYEPIEFVKDVPKTHVKQAITVGRFLNSQGYKIFQDVPPSEYPAHILFTNGGVTGAFNMAVSRLIEYRQVENEFYSSAFATPMPLAPTILVPVPTYGLFLQALERMEKTGKVRILRVMRHDTGAVDMASLKRAIARCNEEGSRIIAYYDCTPHNPTGYIRTVEETHTVADILQQQAVIQNKTQLAYDARHVLGIEEDKSIFTGIAIIDDMAYEGLELIDNKVPYSFAQVSAEVAEQTLTLKGVSKIGFPGARIAAMIGSSHMISHLSEKMLFNEFTAHSLGVDIIAARYSNTQQASFNSHIKLLRKNHRLHAGMLIACINGLDNTDYLTASEKDAFIRQYGRYTGLGTAIACKRLKDGLPHFYTSPEIESGFFTKINFENLRGASIEVVFDKEPVAYEQSVDSSNGLYWVLKAFGIKALPMAWAGASEQTLEARVTFSLKQWQLFEMFDRLQCMHDYFFGSHTPVQPDLFRRTSVVVPNVGVIPAAFQP